jgi:gamma-glutamylcyclotransferase (GGCT)/AIG2-like uncharacterized protein YtfP
MSIYFAYGSNINLEQMKLRCPKAKVLVKYQLKDYQFLINTRGVATIIPNLNCLVEGVLWSLTTECERSLDKYEGVKRNLYTKEQIRINDRLMAIVYLACDCSPGNSRPGYLEKIIQSAQELSFSVNYVDYLNSLLTSSD